MKLNSSLKFILNQILHKGYNELTGQHVDHNLATNLSTLIKQGIPPQYITCCADFIDQELFVAPGTFIPRPETEELVALIKREGDYQLGLEIGVGSGAISIALLNQFSSLYMVGTEISIPAIEICLQNIYDNNLENRMDIIVSQDIDVFKSECFDLIVSNPPYIPRQELKDLPQRVRYEPECSLDGGESGVDIVQKIIKEGNDILKKGGIMAIEIDPMIVSELVHIVQGFKRYSIIPDYSNQERYLIIEK